MADVAKVMGIDIASVAKVMGLQGAKVMGFDWSTFTDPDPIELTTLTLPTVEADTGVVSETPVSANLELSTLAPPSVSADTLLEYGLTYDGNGADAASNVLTGGTASGSDPYSSSNPALAVDGNTGTYYQTRTMGSTWGYDYGEGVTKTWRMLNLYNGSSYRISSVKVEGSNNNSDWDEILGVTELPAETGWNKLGIENDTAYRYYRLTLQGTNRIYLYELEAKEALPDPYLAGWFYVDEVVTVLANTYAKAGFSFNGWNTIDDGSGTDYAAAASITMTAPTTLYAQWVAD